VGEPVPNRGAAPAPGWYADPNGHTRWWSGQAWTEHVAPASVPSAEDSGLAATTAQSVNPEQPATAVSAHYSGPPQSPGGRFGSFGQPSNPPNAYGSPQPAAAPTTAALRAARNKGIGLIVAGIVVFLIGGYSLMNAESRGGIIWIGGFLFGATLAARGVRLLSAVGKHLRNTTR
jgi:Protein of unknown function (DUF2510)